ncbi:MAG: S1 RNA-binding domain-containing protein, partial [Candidatus Pacearchaeota archaeon]|nr:S1 RNA-binding domain-containing protein [Candidatus Pacearchaeota archaeon]
MELETGDVVMCTVDRIAGTVVFVNIDNNGQGSIVLSEVAAGRIRNLRDYVVPKKRIVCKVLRVSPNGNIDLSLRRVTPKEQKEVLERAKQEKGYVSVVMSILGDKSDEAISKMKESDSLYDFLEEAKEDNSILEKIVGKNNSKKILDILLSQKSKKAVLKKEIHLTTTESNGVEVIRDILTEFKDIEIRYISAGKYSVKIEDENLKKADNRFKEI